MAIPGNCASPSAVGGSMQASTGLQNPQDGELQQKTPAGQQTAADTGAAQPPNGEAMLITVLRALSAWAH